MFAASAVTVDSSPNQRVYSCPSYGTVSSHRNGSRFWGEDQHSFDAWPTTMNNRQPPGRALPARLLDPHAAIICSDGYLRCITRSLRALLTALLSQPYLFGLG